MNKLQLINETLHLSVLDWTSDDAVFVHQGLGMIQMTVLILNSVLLCV